MNLLGNNISNYHQGSVEITNDLTIDNNLDVLGSITSTGSISQANINCTTITAIDTSGLTLNQKDSLAGIVVADSGEVSITHNGVLTAFNTQADGSVLSTATGNLDISGSNSTFNALNPIISDTTSTLTFNSGGDVASDAVIASIPFYNLSNSVGNTEIVRMQVRNNTTGSDGSRGGLVRFYVKEPNLGTLISAMDITDSETTITTLSAGTVNANLVSSISSYLGDSVAQGFLSFKGSTSNIIKVPDNTETALYLLNASANEFYLQVDTLNKQMIMDYPLIALNTNFDCQGGVVKTNSITESTTNVGLTIDNIRTLTFDGATTTNKIITTDTEADGLTIYRDVDPVLTVDNSADSIRLTNTGLFISEISPYTQTRDGTVHIISAAADPFIIEKQTGGGLLYRIVLDPRVAEIYGAFTVQGRSSTTPCNLFEWDSGAGGLYQNVGRLRFNLLVSDVQTTIMDLDSGGLNMSGGDIDMKTNSILNANTATFSSDITYAQPYAEMYENVTTATIISTISTWTKVLFTSTQSSLSSAFTHTSPNRLTYTGASTKVFHIDLSFTIDPATNTDINWLFSIFKTSTVNGSGEYSGSPIASSILGLHSIKNGYQYSSAVHCFVSLAQNDYIEFACMNNTSTDNMTCDYMSVCIMGMPN